MDKMIQARSALLLDMPFFGNLSLKLELIEDEKEETMATDGDSIFFNPDFVLGISLYDVKMIIAHEIGHIVLNHHTRRGDRDLTEWNLSCDYADNAWLKSGGMQIPEYLKYSPAFDNQSAEKIHKELFGKKKKEDENGDDSGKQNKAGQDDKQQSQGNEPDKGDKGNQGGSQAASNDDSSQFEKDKTQKDKLSKAGGVKDAKDEKGNDLSESEKAEKEQEWQIAVTQSANMAEKAGELPGGIRNFVTAMNEPKLDWKEVLNRFVLEQVQNDYSFSRRNRRYNGNIILPSLYNTELKPILLAIDTSGSITEEDKKLFASEVEEIIYQFNLPVNVVYCDTKIRHTETFDLDTLPVKLDCRGGGGTRFKPVMEYIETLEEAPSCLVYLTDLECYDFGNEPDVPVLWVQTRGNIRMPVPFGEVVLLK